ncbi:class I SAM-dependent RNA methyltransferase [Actinomadura livida]|uniref:Class I SAM-dependent RNA methyltransferase n=1 Tax=Actinomadura livida TaxID=79909 RepID=A0A7W7IBR3_9ACTN|nr:MULTISPECIES: class I SAM-dependent RNA methyltransferase [Actinomadura]MBB4774076.1 tRNA/tmRNA/rRNA uracil-C5-methylase (TrmA/RlmC/RlmD family) [Actinomadura catellatispora]GGT85071.1 putative RNA methyltransferase [Actinomadura livida]
MTELEPDVLELEVGNVANGGFCVARHEGRVVFVRHALPGERVRARITDRTKNFLRADAVEIIEASPDRVEPPCPFAGPGRCGGCDWQHASLPAQRALKAAVVEEQLQRLAGITRTVTVEEVPYPVDSEVMPPPGLGWRTRVQFAVSSGAVGLRKHRSHDIEPIDECLIAHPGVELMGIERKRWPGASGVEGIVSASTGDRLVVLRGRDRRKIRVPRLDVPVRLVRGKPEPGSGLPYVREEVSGRLYQVSGSGFWQVHPGAAQLLADAVVEALEPKPGDIALDLYCGAGLFAGVLGDRIGPDGLVVGVESDGQAVRDARYNLRDLPNVSIERGPVEEVVAELEFGRASGGGSRAQNKRGGGHQGGERVRRADVVVLDPPRAGAGREVVEQITRLAGRKIAYVSCDPATLARDLAYFGERGWTLETLRAFDAYPMTQHVECLATLIRG